MSWFTQLFGRKRIYEDLSDEMRQHLEEKADALVEQGMSRKDAEAAARRAFGNTAALEEESRETWQWPGFETLLLDVRFALRQLRREPSFTIVAVAILALGIGATTAVFSLVNAVLLRPLPFVQPERLVRISNTGSEGDLSSLTSRSSNLRDWRELNESFEEMGAYFAFFDYKRFTLTGKGEPERLVGVEVTESFLPTLGVEPMLGRQFTHEECVFNGRAAIMLTYRFWQRRFDSDKSIVGQSITLNDNPITIVGVLPESFDFASFFAPGARIDFLGTFPVSKETDRWGNTLAVIGRLKPGVTEAQAQSELDLINERLKAAQPDRWGLGARVAGLRENITGKYRDALWVLAGAVGLVLLIACTNLSNLLLARSTARRKEIAVRSAVGAGRGRVVRQLLTEAILLAACGGALGILVAYGMTRAVAATQAVTIPLLHSARLDGSALAVALVAVLSTGLLFGIAPAIHASASKEYDSLRGSGRGSSEGKDRVWLRNGLVVFEAALACVLLVGTGLLLRSFVRILDADLGFQPEQRVAWRVETGRSFDSLLRKAQFYEGLQRRIGAIAGVSELGLTDTLPLGRNRSWDFGAKGVQYRDGEYPNGFPRMVSAGYLEAMGIRLIEGRTFAWSDTEDSERVVVINQA
ncbi:MAG: ABC transporter permease, partial [Bryobacterales bacterium]